MNIDPKATAIQTTAKPFMKLLKLLCMIDEDPTCLWIHVKHNGVIHRIDSRTITNVDYCYSEVIKLLGQVQVICKPGGLHTFKADGNVAQVYEANFIDACASFVVYYWPSARKQFANYIIDKALQKNLNNKTLAYINELQALCASSDIESISFNRTGPFDSDVNHITLEIVARKKQ